MSIKIVDSRKLPNSWRIVNDKLGNFRSRGLPFRFSYVGSFAQALAEYFVRVYSNPGDTIFDPFSGRGTVGMQSLFHGRNMVCNDLSAYSNVLCHSVMWIPHIEDVLGYVEDLRLYIDNDDNLNNINVSYTGKCNKDDIALLYEPETFSKIVKLRNTLNSPKFIMGHGIGKYDAVYEHEITMFIRSCMTQLMLGSSLTFNGLQVRGTNNTGVKSLLKYYDSIGEKPKYVNIFDNIKNYVKKMDTGNLRLREKFSKFERKLISCDVRNLDLPDKCIDGVITSPPYFHVLCYGKSNWTRLWVLDSIGDPLVKTNIMKEIKTSDSSDIHGKIYDNITDSTASTLDNIMSYSSFTGRYLKELYRVLKDDAFAIIIVGDYGNKNKIEAWRLVVDRAVLFGFKAEMIIMDQLTSSVKASSQFNAKQGGGKNDYDVAVVLYKGNYKRKNNPEDIDFRWSTNYVDSKQLNIEDAWR